MGFPVTINGHTYAESDFSGYGYKTALPALIADVAAVVSSAVASAGAASGSAGSALADAASAWDAAAAALATLHEFDDIYYGKLAADPTLKPSGAAMEAGDLYWSIPSSEMRAYDGAAWSAAYLPSGAYALLAGLATQAFSMATAAQDTDTTQGATTAFVLGQAGTANPAMNGAVVPGASKRFSRQDHVHPIDTSRAADNAVAKMGKQTVGVGAGGLFPATTNGCSALARAETTTHKINYSYLAFDPATDQHAWFAFPSPKSYNASTVTFRPVWTHPATTTNFKAAWAFQVVAMAPGDNLDTALGAAVQVNATGGTKGYFYSSDESAAVTPGNAAAKQDWLFCRVKRVASDVTNDTLAVVAHLVGVEVYYTTDAPNDA